MAPDAPTVVLHGSPRRGGGGFQIIRLEAPFSNGDGEVGFIGGTSGATINEYFVWFDSGILWRNTDAPPAGLHP